MSTDEHRGSNDEHKRTEFYHWTKRKVQLDFHGRQSNFHEGEIYWAGLGLNIGSEIYGKGESYARPVLVYKKLGRYSLLAIPLTSKIHHGSWYVDFRHAGKHQTAVLSQIRVISVKRLFRKIGQIDDEDFKRIRGSFHELY